MSDELRKSALPPGVLRACLWLTSAAPTPLLVTEGPEHIVHYVNPAFLELVGTGVASPVGRPLVEVLPEVSDPGRRESLDLVYQTGEPRRTPDFMRVDPRRGERVFALCTWPVVETGEEARYLVVEVRDITEQARELRRELEDAEEIRRTNERLVVASVRMQELADEAETSRRRLALLAETGRLLSASFDTSTMLPAVARLVVPSLGDVCAIDLLGGPGTVARTVIEPEESAGAMARMIACARARTLELGDPLVCAIEGDSADEEEDDDFAQELRACGFAFGLTIPLRSRARVQGVLTVLTRRSALDLADLTLAGEIADRIAMALDRVDLYQRAVSAARARAELLATVSHDLRSPLHTILFSAALLERGPLSPSSEEGRHVGRIQRTAEYMQRLLRDLVDSAKIEAHRFLIDREPCPVASLVSDVVEMMMPLAANKSIRIEMDLDTSAAGAVIWLDRVRMAQVLTNLIGNAVKFTPERGAIVVRAALRSEELVLSVRDTGPGIPEEDRERLFDRFWQARQTAKLGAGLGLFIARGIVLAHGGTIWVESELGASSTFYVAIPAAPRPDAKEDSDSSAVA
jgi:PAS domain S-box-containing protein